MAFLKKIFGYMIFCYSIIVYFTGRWSFKNKKLYDEALAHERVLFTLWHESLLSWMIYICSLDGKKMSTIIPEGPRTESMETLAHAHGLRTFRTKPDDSPLKNAVAINMLVKDILSGRNSFIIPDGPSGPKYICKPGVAYIAIKADAIILPLTIKSYPSIGLNNWDRARIPLPFSRIEVVFGKPIHSSKYKDSKYLAGNIQSNLMDITDNVDG